MNPPLRTEEDRRAIIDGLRDGTIDCLATDHAPHANIDKDKEFDQASFGILGLETAFAVCHQVLVRENRFTLRRLIELMTVKPAEVLKLPAGTLSPDATADIVVLAPDEEWTYDAARGYSKSANSPWHGRQMRGRVRTTIVAGEIVYSDGKILV
jgi:dihydroorotase